MMAAAILAACTGNGPGPSRTPADNVAVASDAPNHPQDRTSLQLATDVPVAVVAPEPPRAPTDPPIATKPARPLEFIVEKPDSLLDDTCMACGGAVWRTLLRNVNAYPQFFGDNILLRDNANGASPKILLMSAKTGVLSWMRTLKSSDTSASLSLQGLHFLADGTIAVMLEENRGGRANRKLVLIGLDGSRIDEFDYDPSLSGLYVQALESGFLVTGRRYSSKEDPVERSYLSLHDAKGQTISAWLDEQQAQVECALDRRKNSLICGFMFRQLKLTRRVEYDTKTLKVISKTDRPIDWLRPFFVDGQLYHGVLEKPGNHEWTIFRVDPSGHEKLVLKTKRTLSSEMGTTQFLVEYGGRERRYFPLFSTSDEPAHVIIGPETAQVNLGPGGDAFTFYEGIFARWAAEKGPKGGTIATMKLLTR